jgi:hypothetical protein
MCLELIELWLKALSGGEKILFIINKFWEKAILALVWLTIFKSTL